TMPRCARMLRPVVDAPARTTAVRARAISTAPPATAAAVPAVMPSTASARRRSPPAAGAGPRASYRGPSADLLEGGRPDAGDLQQPVHGGEGAVLLPVLEDPLSDRRAHPGQLLELGGIGGVQVDRGPVGAVGGLCCGVGGA